MKNLIICLSFLFCNTLYSSAQEYCKKTVVHFEFGSYALTSTAKGKLAELIKTHKEGQFLVELSGHTDSVNTAEFNIKLSGKRIDAVKKYINRRIKADIVVKLWARGESKPVVPNTSDNNMAQNRRVEIFFTPKNDNQLIFEGTNGATVIIPSSVADSCSICESNPKVTSYYSDSEAKQGNVSLDAGSGIRLSSNAMVNFSLNCEEGHILNCFPISARLEKAKMKQCYSRWSMENNSWQRSEFHVTKDSIGNGQVFTVDCYNPDTWLALGLPTYEVGGKYVSPLCTHKIKYAGDLQFAKVKIADTDTIVLSADPVETLSFSCGNPKIFTWASSGDQQYYIKDNLSKFQTSSTNLNANCDKGLAYILTKNSYNEIAKSDTTIRIKAKQFEGLSQVAFYIEELDLAIPIANTKKVIYEANYLNYKHRLRFVESTTYDLTYADTRIKVKYKKGKQMLLVVVKKKKLI